MPGTYPSRVRIKLIQKCNVSPTVRNTAKGGKRTARIKLMIDMVISLWGIAIETYYPVAIKKRWEASKKQVR